MGVWFGGRCTSQLSDHHPLEQALVFLAHSNSHRAEIVQLLLDHGADPNGRWCPFESRARRLPNVPSLYAGCFSDGGITPLMWVASIGDVVSVKALVKTGADSALRDGDGHTVMDKLSVYKDTHPHREEIIEIVSR